MTIDDATVFKILVNILDIEDEPENVTELKNWIKEKGIEFVFKKVMEIEINMSLSSKVRDQLTSADGILRPDYADSK